MISRRLRVQEKRSNKKGLYLLFISLILLGLLVVFGIPILIQSTNFVSQFKPNSQNLNSDKTPPAPPQFEPQPPLFSHEAKITLQGRSEANSLVTITKNGQKQEEIKVPETAKFTVNIQLSEGDNVFYLSAQDQAENQGPDSSPYHILFDNIPPTLDLSKPYDGESFYFPNQTISVEGKSEKGVNITINERMVIVGIDGSFSQKIKLESGDNELKIVAKDQAENQTEKIIKVTYTP